MAPSGVSSTGTYKNNKRTLQYRYMTQTRCLVQVVYINGKHLSHWIHLQKLGSLIRHTHLKILDQFNFHATIFRSNECFPSILVWVPRVQNLQIIQYYPLCIKYTSARKSIVIDKLLVFWSHRYISTESSVNNIIISPITISN